MTNKFHCFKQVPDGEGGTRFDPLFTCEANSIFEAQAKIEEAGEKIGVFLIVQDSLQGKVPLVWEGELTQEPTWTRRG